MRIEIKTPGDGWILQRFAEWIQRYSRNEVTLTRQPSGRADVTYFCHYNEFEPVNTTTAALFTHLEPPDHPLAARWREVAGQVDLCIAMSEPYRQHLPQDKTAVILPGVAESFTPAPIRVGVAAQRAHGNDYRKGRDLLARLRYEGHHWFTLVECAGEIDYHAMPAWYRGLDVYLVSSRYEGGPMPALEAAACGIPIVAPRVGFIDALIAEGARVVTYPPGDYDAMVYALETFRRDNGRLHLWTWQRWARQHDRWLEEAHGLRARSLA